MLRDEEPPSSPISASSGAPKNPPWGIASNTWSSASTRRRRNLRCNAHRVGEEQVACPGLRGTSGGNPGVKSPKSGERYGSVRSWSPAYSAIDSVSGSRARSRSRGCVANESPDSVRSTSGVQQHRGLRASGDPRRAPGASTAAARLPPADPPPTTMRSGGPFLEQAAVHGHAVVERGRVRMVGRHAVVDRPGVQPGAPSLRSSP